MKITDYLDSFLNNTPMYKLVIYVLILLSAGTFIESYFAKVPFTPVELLISLLLTLVICVGLNFVFAKSLKLPIQYESSIITSLILFLVLNPETLAISIISLILASCIATASKYFIVARNTHIFNPAAFGIYTVTILGFGTNLWWVGNFYLLPAILILGILIIRKTQRTTLIIAALIGSFIGMSLDAYFFQTSFFDLLNANYISGPYIFFLTVMLTEPHTIAKNKNQQIIYGMLATLIIPILMLLNLPNFIPLDLSLSLLIVNLISFVIAKRQRLILKFKSISKLSQDMNEYTFVNATTKAFNFTAGEYMEVVIPESHSDSRGSRRYFTISSFSSEEISFATKFPEKDMSAWKTDLQNLKIGDIIYATQFGGDFLLPKNKKNNLALVAGGIGITPFIAQIRDLIHKNENRNITLFFCVKNHSSIIYLDLFKQAMEIMNLRVIFVISDTSSQPPSEGGEVHKNFYYETGYMTMEILNKYLQDIPKTEFYVSGPSMMVDMVKKVLHTTKIPSKNILTDYFPGF